MSTQPTLDRPVQTADRTRRADPAKLSHYVSIKQMDQFILGEIESVDAICGYTWHRQVDDPDINAFAEARKPGRSVCWKCEWIHSLMKKASTSGGAS